jgi:uncharacterized protein YndB with AHSA1/START domain
MTRSIIHQPDPKLDLVFERIVDVPRELIWTAWTTPEQLKQWFTPAPWKTVDCEEIVENEKLVWTNALVPGFRPKAPEAASCVTFFFTAIIALEPHGNGTKYTALVLHSDEEARKKHEEMRFHEGWGKALEQLVAVVKKK